MISIDNSGPKYTISEFRKIKGEDHLGIRSVGISIADRLQSGITSITPRARYWSFFAWVLYDFIENIRVEKTMKNFKLFLRKQEWFFILANIAEAERCGYRTHELIGSTKGLEVWNSSNDPVEPKLDYVKNALGGYGTYRNVMKVAGLTAIGNENEGVYIDRLTQPLGKKLAQAFEANIRHTAYYQTYRLLDEPVPRDVIHQYGQAASLDLLKNDQSDEHVLLEDIFIPKEPKTDRQKNRKGSMLYYMAIINQSKDQKLTFHAMQSKMFDDYYHKEIHIPEQLNDVATGWEIYQARQLFTFSLDTIWSFLLQRMSKKIMTMEELISSTLQELELKEYDLTQNLQALHRIVPLSQETRNEAINHMSTAEYHVVYHVWQPLLVMLDMYHRTNMREDFVNFHQDLLDLGGSEAISLTTWIAFVDASQQKTVREVIAYLLRYYILEQHQHVALNKVLTTHNETYHFIENDGFLYFIKDDKPVFNTFRVNQGLSILQDLGFLEKRKGMYHVNPLGQVRLNESH